MFNFKTKFQILSSFCIFLHVLKHLNSYLFFYLNMPKKTKKRRFARLKTKHQIARTLEAFHKLPFCNW